MDTQYHISTMSSPPLSVSVLTGGAAAAIASVALCGRDAERIVGELFRRSLPACGRLAFGPLQDGDTVVDSVVLGRERTDCFVLHCHGNPLLVEQIVRVCQRYGARLQSADEYLFGQLQAACRTPIEAEARLAMTRAATREGVELIAGQIEDGLSAWAKGWIKSKSFEINQLHDECAAILRRSKTAQRLINGVRIGLLGPPNSGKSTLLNRLAAENAAIVSDSAGTTRDWVSTTCRIGPLRAEVIDTAGLDTTLAVDNVLDRAAQHAAVEVVKTCDLVLHIRDCTRQQPLVLPMTVSAAGLTVYTKSDLLPNQKAFSPDTPEPWVLVSALTGQGVEVLGRAILAVLKIDSLEPHLPICFTDRQRTHLQTLATSDCQVIIKKELTSLLGAV